MKKAYIVTSAIDVDNSHPLTYSSVRSTFTNEERLRHTIFTIASLDHISDNESYIFLIDTSENSDSYRELFRYQPNLIYISVKDEFPDVYEITRTHKNKSYCETLLLISFLNKYKKQLEQFDYFFKLSGRYFIDSKFDPSVFNEENINKLFFKKPLAFEWNDSWPYAMVDRRSIQGNNKLHQYCSVLYGWGKEHHHKMVDIYKVVNVFTDHPNGIYYDLETLLYFFTRQYEANIIETDWLVYGWEGVSGAFMRY
jgi:hypothetical protein